MPLLPPILGGSAPKFKRGGSEDLRPSGSRWRKLRLTVLDDYPVCVYCQSRGRMAVPSTIVDHIIALSLGGSSLASNLIGCCNPCNQEKRRVEQAWLNAGWPIASLDRAARVMGSLKWFVDVARAAQEK